jgi:hypothetical protein
VVVRCRVLECEGMVECGGGRGEGASVVVVKPGPSSKGRGSGGILRGDFVW